MIIYKMIVVDNKNGSCDIIADTEKETDIENIKNLLNNIRYIEIIKNGRIDIEYDK